MEIMSRGLSGFEVKCMKFEGLKFWRWHIIEDEQLYRWEDVIQKIRTPKFFKRGYCIIRVTSLVYN